LGGGEFLDRRTNGLLKKIVPILTVAVILLSPVVSGLASAQTVNVGVHVGEKLIYLTVGTVPPKTASLGIVTITGIFIATGSPYTVGDLIVTFSITGISEDGTVATSTGWFDMTNSADSQGNGALALMPANIQAGPYSFGGNTLNVQTKRVCDQTIDYTTLTMPSLANPEETWTCYFEWYQSTGVVIYMNFNFPPMFVGTITLLGQIPYTCKC
jgi:hypothetical protein